LQKLLGYSITGYVNQQKFIIWTGSGGNGKGILMNLIRFLMKDYYQQCTQDLVIKGKKKESGSATPHVMQLMGCRLAFVDENERDAKLNDSIVKNTTGGSAITGRFLFGNQITFEPTHQIFLITNHTPEIDVTPSIKRRIILIPFLAEYKSKTDMDPKNPRHKLKNDEIEAKLKEKLDELLVWLVNGSVKYFKEGLNIMPEVAKEATKEYFDENDYLQSFLDEKYIKSSEGFVYSTDLYDSYLDEYNIGLSQRSFTRRFKIATGIRATEYWQQLRIETAKDLLGSSNLSIQEIAFHVGYQDQGHLTRLFKKYLTLTPKEYRAMVRKKLFSQN